MSDEKPQAENEEPKIIVDEDWKSQAESEKEKLQEQEKAAGAGGAAGPSAGTRELPPASFASLVSGLVTQILFALGAIEDPQSRRRFRNLPLAKYHIDVLSVLEEKTQGNLDDEERKLLDNALYETRMAYVRTAQEGT